jgi:hypothetical protein
MEADERSQREGPVQAFAGETAAPRVRHKMRLALTRYEVAPGWPLRSITTGDAQALALLMYDAYHGTIDDEGETSEDTLHEVEATLGGRYRDGARKPPA